jgi:hypothetical protein
LSKNGGCRARGRAKKGVNEFGGTFEQAYSLLVRRGGCGINKNFGEAHLSAADGVVAHKP